MTKNNKPLRLCRREYRIVQRWGEPALFVSKIDGTVVATGDEAWSLHRKLFKKRLSVKKG